MNSQCLNEKCCLIATDIDKTIISEEKEKKVLYQVVGLLADAASHGTQVAFITGNSMNELCINFLKIFIKYLLDTDNFHLLDRFHFFCNSGGVYVRFPFNLKSKLFREKSNEKSDNHAQKLFDQITFTDGNNNRRVKAPFVNTSYLNRCKIPDGDIEIIQQITDNMVEFYIKEIEENRSHYCEKYDIKKICDGNQIKKPTLELRPVSHILENNKLVESTVQVTLKPILSFQYAINNNEKPGLIGNDLRSCLVKKIQQEFDDKGLSHLIARPAGRSSIDICLQKLDKAYALEFLIDHLNLQEYPRSGKKFGSNVIYFGDEVIAGGG